MFGGCRVHSVHRRPCFDIVTMSNSEPPCYEGPVVAFLGVFGNFSFIGAVLQFHSKAWRSSMIADRSMCTWCASFSMSTKYDRRRELDIQDIHVRSSGTNFLQGRVRRTPQSVVELLDDGREGALVGIVRSLGPGHAGGRQLLANKPLSQKK